MSDTFTPRVVKEIPPTTAGARNKTIYDEVFSLAVSSAPDAVLGAESVPSHRAMVMRDAMNVRLERTPDIKGAFNITSRTVGKEEVDGRTVRLVDIYVAFAPEKV